MATMQDIADAVGVSKAAVSRILNHKGSFSEETVARVEEAARRLGYARGAIAQPSEEDLKLISTMFPTTGSPYYGILASLLAREADRYGYRLVVAGTMFGREVIEENIRLLRQQRVRGLIVSTFADYMGLFDDPALPIVTVGTRVMPQIPSAHSDDLAVGRIAARHLLSRGATEFTYISGNVYGLEHDQRYLGFAETLAEAGREVSAYHLSWDDIKSGGAANVVMQMALEHPKANGVFAESQTLSMECLTTYQSLGYRIPDDVRIVGYGYPYLSQWCTPRLTVIRENTPLLAQRAMELLVEQIEHPRAPQSGDAPEVIVPVSLEVNQTS